MCVNNIQPNQENNKNNSVIDMMLSRGKIKTIDRETLIKNTQKRIWRALKNGYEYDAGIIKSEKFLRANVFSRINMAVLYVDLVGSTTMTLELPIDKFAIIISSFAQEMGSVIMDYDGHILKFVGDAVIGYFVAQNNQLLTADNAVNCAKSMIDVINKGINPILNQYGYPELMAKIGIDFGQNTIVRYGTNKDESHVDLLGPSMNIASKIQNYAKPNQILIGGDIYEKLHPNIQKNFQKIKYSNKLSYYSKKTGKIYSIYKYIKQRD